MDNKSEPIQYIPLFWEGEDFPFHIFSVDRVEMKMLIEMAEKTGRDPNELFKEYVREGFKNIFGFDPVNMSLEEWKESVGEDEVKKRLDTFKDKIKLFREEE